MADICRTEVPGGILYAPVSTASSSTTLVVGTPGRKIVVLSVWLVASNQVNAKFQSSTGPADLTGFADCAQFGGFVLGFNSGGWFETALGDSLVLNLSSGTPVGGSLSYILV